MSKDKRSQIVMPSRRRFLINAAAGGGAATMGAMFPSILRADTDTIRIGVMVPLQIQAGTDNLHGVQIAAEEINAAGGIMGRKVEVIAADDEALPEKGIQAYQKLVQRDKVHGIIGGFRSGVISALHPYIARYKVPFIITGAASPAIMAPVVDDYENHKYLFRAASNSDTIAQDMANVCNDVLAPQGIKKYAIDAENFAWAHDYANALKKKFEQLGLELVYETTHDPTITDFTPIFKQVTASGAQAMCCIISNVAGYTLVKQWREQRVPVQLVNDNNGSFLLDSFWKDTQGACEFEISNGCQAPLTEKSLATWQKFDQRYGGLPIVTALAAYDCVYLYKMAIEKHGATDSDSIVDGLESIDYVGAIGRVVFGKDHEAIHDEDHLITPWGQWRGDRRKEALWPTKFATAPYAPPSWMS